ncbi:hypothetical protein PTTG_29315 [Puccinia triticina 1-1 BBBD Race 1]|uniref:Myb_DNA-bind_3 domain-containing protein n=1 Tax=Puccinia triticina (isolate 1-1 / race 1 (BBBD)) TaxID=630390 RepID=A0A180G539_PUCT1|nr:hypothetical protein PTTG_29315 [Puccinia triticina 1-1 BBBD Race 1]
MGRQRSSQPTHQSKPPSVIATPNRRRKPQKQQNTPATPVSSATPATQSQKLTQATCTEHPGSTQNPGSQSQIHQLQPEDSPKKDKTKNLIWTAGMECSAIEMYVKAVESGKRGEAGFKPKVHQSVAIELAKEFPGVKFTVAKVKSKFSQSFKKVWDAFSACKGASGFGWNEAECMVTASKEVWNSFLVSHPNAKRFKNTPFPEYSDYQVIFEGNTASGVLRRTSGTELIDAPEEDAPTGDNQDPAEDADVRNRPTQTSTQRPGVRPPRRHRVTSGDRSENSINRLAEAFLASNPQPKDAESSIAMRAMEKFQDHFADHLSLEELVAGFDVLKNESNASTFLAIRSNDHAQAWLEKQIDSQMSSAN